MNAPCIDCGLIGPWHTEHGLRCLEHDRAYRARRKAAEKGQGGISPHARCAVCGARERLTRDHIVPLSRGGTSVRSNLQTLCVSCNARKGKR